MLSVEATTILIAVTQVAHSLHSTIKAFLGHLTSSSVDGTPVTQASFMHYVCEDSQSPRSCRSSVEDDFSSLLTFG